MHYVLQDRHHCTVLDPVSDVAGGMDVMSVSTTSSVCGPGAMVAVSPLPAQVYLSQILMPAPRGWMCTTSSSCSRINPPVAPTSWAWDFENDGVVDDITQNPCTSIISRDILGKAKSVEFKWIR